jgi:hypothetical protein
MTDLATLIENLISLGGTFEVKTPAKRGLVLLYKLPDAYENDPVTAREMDALLQFAKDEVIEYILFRQVLEVWPQEGRLQ